MAALRPRFGADGWRLLSFYPAEGGVEVSWLGLPRFTASARLIPGGVPASLAEANNCALLTYNLGHHFEFELLPYHTNLTVLLRLLVSKISY